MSPDYHRKTEAVEPFSRVMASGGVMGRRHKSWQESVPLVVLEFRGGMLRGLVWCPVGRGSSFLLRAGLQPLSVSPMRSGTWGQGADPRVCCLAVLPEMWVWVEKEQGGWEGRCGQVGWHVPTAHTGLLRTEGIFHSCPPERFPCTYGEDGVHNLEHGLNLALHDS